MKTTLLSSNRFRRDLSFRNPRQTFYNLEKNDLFSKFCFRIYWFFLFILRFFSFFFRFFCQFTDIQARVGRTKLILFQMVGLSSRKPYTKKIILYLKAPPSLPHICEHSWGSNQLFRNLDVRTLSHRAWSRRRRNVWIGRRQDVWGYITKCQ